MSADSSQRPKQTKKQANLRQIYFKILNKGRDKRKEWLGRGGLKQDESKLWGSH